MIVAGVDAGGTSWKAVIASGPGAVSARRAFPTGDPQTTIGALCDWVEAELGRGPAPAAIGLACFGPVDRDPASGEYGLLGRTPKQGWRGVNPRLEIERRLGLSCALDTDVNGALMAEQEWGALRGLKDAAYVTVGTGIGGAAIVNGSLVGRPFHSEFGHFRPARLVDRKAAFAGVCPSHGDCLEGLVSASAVEARWGARPHELDDDHEAWPIIANMLAQLCAALTYFLAPQRIVLGGGLLQRPSLIGRIRTDFTELTNGYGLRPEACDIERYLALPGLGADAGAFGGVLLAQRMLRAKERAGA